MPKRKPKHIFHSVPIEIMHEILSHLHLNDLANMVQVSKWLYSVISPLRLDYWMLSIKKNENISSQFPTRQIFIWTEQTCTYTQLRKKLTAQLPYKKEWTRTIERIKQDSHPFSGTDLLKAAGTIVIVGILPMVVGGLVDYSSLNIKSLTAGLLTGYDVGYGISMSVLLGFCYWLFKETYSQRDYKPVQLIEEELVSFSLPKLY